MVEDRGGLGAFISAVGAATLAVAVFLPWYGVTLTAGGAASAQQAFDTAAQQLLNPAAQAAVSPVSDGFGALAGHQLGTMSAHELLKDLSAMLLVLAAVSLLAALSRLGGSSSPVRVARNQLALAGAAAVLCVGFRMVALPSPGHGYLTLSLSWGIWLALAAAVAIVVGGLWPAAATSAPELGGAQVEGPLPDLDAYWRA